MPRKSSQGLIDELEEKQCFMSRRSRAESPKWDGPLVAEYKEPPTGDGSPRPPPSPLKKPLLVVVEAPKKRKLDTFKFEEHLNPGYNQIEKFKIQISVTIIGTTPKS